MLYTQFNMDDALEVRYEEGLEEGLERGIQQGLEQGIKQGLSQGERRLLIRLVYGKLRKGENPEKIAEDLLADRKEIDRICQICKECGFDEEAIFKKLKSE